MEICPITDWNMLKKMDPVIGTSIGRDSLVRSVRLKTKSNEPVRPVTKVVFLEAVGHDVVPHMD